jgi:MoaA/NifB/PqqE/SkfB family radical SAM enzyme
MLMKDDLKTEDWVNILEQGARLGCREVQFIGGEPTLFRDLISLVNKSRELGYTFIEIYTNATLLTDAQLDELQSYNVNIATSFYSHRPEIHDAITQRKGSFERTVQTIKEIVRKGIPLRVGIITLTQNKDDVQATIDLLVSLGIDKKNVRVDRVRGEGRGSSLVKERDAYSHLCGNCWSGKLTVSSDGNIYPCVFARQFKVGNIRHEQLTDVLKKNELLTFRHKVHDMFKKKRQETKNQAPEQHQTGHGQEIVPIAPRISK